MVESYRKIQKCVNLFISSQTYWSIKPLPKIAAETSIARHPLTFPEHHPSVLDLPLDDISIGEFSL